MSTPKYLATWRTITTLAEKAMSESMQLSQRSLHSHYTVKILKLLLMNYSRRYNSYKLAAGVYEYHASFHDEKKLDNNHFECNRLDAIDKLYCRIQQCKQ